jgi:nucleoside-diphosphate-sugar epimerase
MGDTVLVTGSAGFWGSQIAENPARSGFGVGFHSSDISALSFSS